MITTRLLTADWGVTGLTGTLAYRVLDANGGTLVARTTTGVSESPAGSGLYRVKVATWDTAWVGEVVWDAGGSGVGSFAVESFDVMDANLASVTGSTAVAKSLADNLAGRVETVTIGNNDSTEPARIVGIDTSAGTPAAGWTALFMGTEQRTVLAVLDSGGGVWRATLDSALSVIPEGGNTIVFVPPVKSVANAMGLAALRAQVATDTGETSASGGSVAKLAGGAAGNVGPGADQVTITLTDDGTTEGNPIADADVWISSDPAGAVVVAGTRQTNSEGKALFMLDAGTTYYLWGQRNGFSPPQGQAFVAQAD
jgi:hypothetical protein